MAPTVERVSIKAVEDFSSSFHCLLSEVGTFGLRYTGARDKELTNTRVELDRVRELYNKKGIIVEVELKKKRELFVDEGKGSGTTDLDPSTIRDIVTSVRPSVTRDVMVAATTVENDTFAN
ncbi:hypothetical protein GOBAR_DD19193 [Gossypium barbadense]|nr:hypothetical protein GOBAR_DD19193 [Gossypium barbadense]